MRTFALLALSTLLFAASSSIAAGTCTDEKGFCPFRDAAGAAAPAAADEKCAAMAMADGKKAGCCDAKAEDAAGCCSAEKAAAAGCCGGEKAEGAGCCSGASCGEEKPGGGAAPHAHPGA
jgi:hypothetical protein